MLQTGQRAFPQQRQSVTRHGADRISYEMVRSYVASRRAAMQPQSLSPAHQAVTDHDLNRLRGLLDSGHDIQDDNGDGWTLLRRAIHAEADRHAMTGEPPHADMTAFLLARGASTAAEAGLLGHWLAAEIISSWANVRSQ